MIKVKVYVIVGMRAYCKVIAFDSRDDAMLGFQGMDDHIRNWVNEEWEGYSTHNIKSIKWEYV